MLKSTQFRRLFSTVHLKNHFNFASSFDHLTKSKKYKQYQHETGNDFLKYDSQIVQHFKEQNFNLFKNYDHLDLKSKLTLCDSINSKFLNENLDPKYFNKDQNFREFFDTFIRSKLNQLLSQKYHLDDEHKDSFIRSIDPRLHLKLFFYYANFYHSAELTDYERKFLTDYLNELTSLNYDYDIYELATLFHSIFKLNIVVSESTMAKYVQQFKNLNDVDRQIMFYNIVKLVKQQEYYDEELFKLIKIIFKQELSNLQSKILINIVAAFAANSYYDEEIFKDLENELLIRENLVKRKGGKVLRFKDVTKYLWSLSYFGYDFDQNPKLLKFFLSSLRTLKDKKYRARADSAVDAVKSLIICDIYDYDIINLLVNEMKDEIEFGTKRSKMKSDLFFIIKSLEIERPDFSIDFVLKKYSKPIVRNLMIEMSKRPILNEFIKFLENNLNVKFDFDFVYPLSHINISSIFVSYTDKGLKKSVYIDIVDETNTMTNNPDKLKALFRVKLRQMKAKGFNHVLYKKSNDNNFIKLDSINLS